MTDQRTYDVLRSLYRIVEAGEKGFATAAANVPDPALKILFKRYAGQRSRYMTEIMAHITRLGAALKPGVSIPGIIHRGRIAIFAAMIIGNPNQERMVLREAALGERAALRTYEKALAEPLDGEASEMVHRQYDEIRKASDEVNLIRGHADGRRMLVRLYDSNRDAQHTAAALSEAGIAAQDISQIALKETDLYQGAGATVSETILSAAFGGALWGSLTGVLVGFGIVQTTDPTDVTSMILTWLLAVAGFLLVGALIASVLAIFIGFGIREGDTFQYSEILARRNALLMITTDPSRVDRAAAILDRDPQNGVHPGLSPST